jgi:hypothetical protein
MKFGISKVGDVLLKHSHWVGAFGILFGFVVSAYFYFASKPSGEISLSFKSVKIAQSGIPVVKMFDDKGQAIEADVYGLEIIIWNTGDLSLGELSDRVRKPLTISFKAPVKMLGAVVQDTQNINTQDVRVETDADQRNIRVLWHQFDPTDAIKIFAIYSGQNQSAVESTARIIGTHLANVSDYKETAAPEEPGIGKFYYRTLFEWENHKLRLTVLLLSVLFQLLALGTLILSSFRRGGLEAAAKWITGLMAFSGVLTVLSSTSLFAPKIPF